MSGDVVASSSGGPPSDPSELRLRAQRGGRQQRKRALAELSALEGPSGPATGPSQRRSTGWALVLDL
eukprot:4153184-Alexandrium_andersonii.AAC.1